ncbi:MULTISPECIES: acetyl-CoA C-acyltransferase family protein [unclassified Burkholderia]|uniref:acetyl-CoA C-acyltransferase family protein n=1 Tax=unclassified Burkholderia TaxID=2613784 RepID=UPI000F578E9C|nr:MULTISPECIES: acetyl-CoA C-acyltransferase family protein [unclassified Burkholderia]RQR69830.1 acetyl-CoA C-acyltransferase [Burkholderia sp. Bp9012]RQR73323.1 acetyl-CoA C-acyltransferase [Burkholderia sp. Bp9011]RQR85183.1 acetyl-CoA C-acyltransferase [Burkholderia sp. Bp9010]RQZ40307.1 acetyl-CoA C-acyltransferase [Burkholderia sp. Bp9099]
MKNDVFVIGAVRTAIGAFGGSLASVPPTMLAAQVVRSALEHACLDGQRVEQVVFGHVINTEAADMYLSRVAALNGGCDNACSAFNVNRLCGSGLQAIVSAAQSISMGDVDIAIAGGAESMSRSPYLSQTSRWGVRSGDATLIDAMTGVLHDPFFGIHMGVTAENVAEQWKIGRIEQDQLALESHRRAQRAIQEGRFATQMVPITLNRKGRETTFDTDEHVRFNCEVADLAALRPVFKRESGTVTAGNSSGINDAASAVVLASGRAVSSYGLKPLAKLVAYAHSGVDPRYMGIGPVPATRAVLARAGIEVADLDVIEANEAFAAQALAVTKELGLDANKVNPNGSGISLGHPIGATGAIIVTKAVHELRRIGGRYALATMCIGGGQGIAAVFENAGQ